VIVIENRMDTVFLYILYIFGEQMVSVFENGEMYREREGGGSFLCVSSLCFNIIDLKSRPNNSF
jgi:hypothetical protein